MFRVPPAAIAIDENFSQNNGNFSRNALLRIIRKETRRQPNNATQIRKKNENDDRAKMPSLRTSTKSRRRLLRRLPNDLLPSLQTSDRRGRRALLRRLRSVVESDAQDGESKTRRRTGEELANRAIRRRLRTVGVYSDGRRRSSLFRLA